MPPHMKERVSFFMYSDFYFLNFLFADAETVPVRTVNRQCSSGLQAVADVAAAIKAGFYDIGNYYGLYASFAA